MQGIRLKQKEWLKTRANADRVIRAVSSAFPDIEKSFFGSAAAETGVDNKEAVPSGASSGTGATVGLLRRGEWNQDAIGRSCVQALLGTFIGGGVTAADVERDTTGMLAAVADQEYNKGGWLTDEELDGLLQATAFYRRRGGLRPKKNSTKPGETREELATSTAEALQRKKKVKKVQLASKETYAEQIRGLLYTALSRCPDSAIRSEEGTAEALPLLVSGIVGGSEIYPLLLQWACRHLAVSPGLQQALRDQCTIIDSRNSTSAIGGTDVGGGTGVGGARVRYGSLVPKAVSYMAWAHPYSAAIGPPRKITEDVLVDLPTPSSFTGSTGSEDSGSGSITVLLKKEALLFVLHPGKLSFYNKTLCLSA